MRRKSPVMVPDLLIPGIAAKPYFQIGIFKGQNEIVFLMAEVKVKLFANLREAAGTPEILISGEKVMDVLSSLTEKYPGLKDLIFEKPEGIDEFPVLCGSINVLINGNNIRHLEGLYTLLSDADEIAVLPPVSGG
jgi:sulfur-carrier protein